MPLDFRDFFFIAPEIVLTVWGLLVLLVDLRLARRLSPAARRRTDRHAVARRGGRGAGRGRGRVLCAAFVRADPQLDELVDQSARLSQYFLDADPSIFFGTIWRVTCRRAFFNLLYVVLLGLVVGLSMCWSFTEELGRVLRAFVLGHGRHDAAHRGRRAGHAVPDARDDDDLPVSEHGAREDQSADRRRRGSSTSSTARCRRRSFCSGSA